MANKEPKKPPMNFESMLQTDVPKGRNGKHKHIVEMLLSDLAQMASGSALKVPLDALPDSKENIRSALNRATRQQGIDIVTSSDDEYLYVWKPDPNSPAEK
jgi:TusA-related sulfurtransferase